MGGEPEEELSSENLHADMEVLEPYTTGELASKYDVTRERIRTILERLTEADKIRKKEPEPERAIWIREAPAHECTNCGYEFEVKFLHPMLSSVRFCPRCGTQV